MRLMSGRERGDVGHAEPGRQLREVELAARRLVHAAEFALRHAVAVRSVQATLAVVRASGLYEFEKPVVPACMNLPKLALIAVFWLPNRS